MFLKPGVILKDEYGNEWIGVGKNKVLIKKVDEKYLDAVAQENRARDKETILKIIAQRVDTSLQIISCNCRTSSEVYRDILLELMNEGIICSFNKSGKTYYKMAPISSSTRNAEEQEIIRNQVIQCFNLLASHEDIRGKMQSITENFILGLDKYNLKEIEKSFRYHRAASNYFPTIEDIVKIIERENNKHA